MSGGPARHASPSRSISTASSNRGLDATGRKSSIDRRQVARVASKKLNSTAVLANRERLTGLGQIDEEDREQLFCVEKLATPTSIEQKFNGKFWSGEGADHVGYKLTQEDLAEWYDRPGTDRRTDVDRLTDYMAILAAPSEAELSGGMGPLSATDAYHKSWTTVYEEGFGASLGCAKAYWKQHFVDEDIKTEKERTKSQKMKMWRTPDNQVFHSLQLRTREFFDLGGYRAFPDVVTVEVIFRELFDINATRGTFRVAFILSVRWYDSHFDCADYANQRGEQVYARSIPYLTIDGADAGENAVGVPEEAGSVSSEDKHSGMVTLCKGSDPPGVLYRSMRVSATFRDDSDLTWFPFDMQALSIGFRLWGSNVPDETDEGRILLPLNVLMDLQHAHPEWISLSANATSLEPRGDRQKMTVTLNLRRRPMYFIFNVMVVIGILTTMCFGVFRQTTNADDYEARCQTTLTLMLSSIAYKFFVADMVPKVSYLTVLDVYIYAGLLTCAFIFALNTLTICYPTDDGNCDSEDEIENFGWMALVAFWCCANVFAFATAGWYVYIVYHRDRHLRVYSDNQPAMKEGKENRLRDLMHTAKSNERFFPRGYTTVPLRRYRACSQLRDLELKQFWLMLECGGDLSKWMRHPHRLMNVTPRLLAMPGCRTARHRKHQLTRVDLDGDSGVPELLRRAGLEDKLATLGPLLVASGLTEVRLAAVHNNGQGSATLNALLEKAGVVEPSSRIMILGALEPETEVTSRLLKQLSEAGRKDMFLVLQGSGTYLWQFLKAPDRPIFRTDFLAMIDDALAAYCIDGDKEIVKVNDLRNISNCIVAKLILTSPMLGRAKYVYSRRQITKPRNFYTQIWAGYLRLREGTLWNKHKGDAIAVEIGAAKMAYMVVGSAGTPRAAIEPDELEYRVSETAKKLALNDDAKQTLARLYTKSVVFAHPYLTNVSGHDDHRGLDEHLRDLKIFIDDELQQERYGRSQTDRMRDLCNTILDDWVLPVYNEEKNVKYVLLYGTAQLRREIADLEMLCGSLASQHLGEIAIFCTELMVQKGHDVKVTFELLKPHEQAECHSIAVQEGLGNMDATDTADPPLVHKLQQTLLDDPAHNTFGCATVGMREILGMAGGEKFVVPVGLDHALSGLTDLARIQQEAMAAPGHMRASKHGKTQRENMRRSTLEPSRFTSTASSLPTVPDGPLTFSGLQDAIEVTTRDLAKTLQNLSSQIRPFHPAVSGPHSARLLRTAKAPQHDDACSAGTVGSARGVRFGFRESESVTEETSAALSDRENESDEY
eukprot:m.59226 g.59226  ORF g.59226 m.59226 type:complete len:1286 (+) comp17317_c0_seq1:49-3906(+)